MIEVEQGRIFSPRFGEVTFDEREVIAFPWALPGFPNLRRFLVLSIGGQEGLFWLQSVEEPKVAMPLADPWLTFPDYEPRLPSYARTALDLRAPDEFVILCVVVAPSDGEMTMNLLAPVVINLRTNIGRQIMLDDASYAIRTPMPKREVSGRIALETGGE
jgi:flagellar assembly factor FliW